MSIQEKFGNFKKFVKDVAKNQETIALYADMNWFKLQAMAYTLLPNRHRLDEIVAAMQDKLDFPDEHKAKFKRYMELFVEYMAGESQDAAKPPEYITSESMSYNDRLALYMKEQAQKNL